MLVLGLVIVQPAWLFGGKSRPVIGVAGRGARRMRPRREPGQERVAYICTLAVLQRSPCFLLSLVVCSQPRQMA
jgi:hypothetical protein